VADLWVTTLGEVPYRDALALQERLRGARQANIVPDCLLLLEHPPVYTRGRRAEPGDLPLGEDSYRTRGIEVADSDRGGQVTYHGPGQLVGYPIMRIHSVHDFVRTMERAMIAALADEGIPAQVRDGLTGVWAGDAKIVSIGIHVSRSITTHGFAINVDNDLEPFDWIRPCGIDGARMTSVAGETGHTGSMSCFRKRTAHRFAEAFGMRQRLVSSRQLILASARASSHDRAPAAFAAGRKDAQRSVAESAPLGILAPRPTSPA
jgi:lipoate-protein ligase B